MNREPDKLVDPARVKCLIVDDLDENRLALSALLASDDIELLDARSGREALELLLAHDVALALIDVQMPEMDGFELAELIRGSARTRHVPIVFVTAGNRDRHRMFAGYESGAVDFIYKPIDAQILRSKAAIFFELHRHRQKLARELHERSEALRFNELFIAMLGHDLRNPLSAMLASAQLLKKRHADAGVQQTADRLLASGHRMSRMIEDVLDVARARLGGGISLRVAETDLGRLTDQVVQEQRAAASERTIDVRRRGDLSGAWDLERLSQVLANLLGNAVQHGAAGAISVDLDGSDPAVVALRVANAGRIPPALLPHIFDPFRGGDHPRGRNDGLGLGLFIVQQIVQAHGGTIQVDSSDASDLQSDASEGGELGPIETRTAFTVRLPRQASLWQTPADRWEPLR